MVHQETRSWSAIESRWRFPGAAKSSIQWLGGPRGCSLSLLVLRLFAFVNRKSLLYPIDVETARQDQDPQSREPTGLQCGECRPQVRALLEWTASAIQYNVRIS